MFANDLIQCLLRSIEPGQDRSIDTRQDVEAISNSDRASNAEDASACPVLDVMSREEFRRRPEAESMSTRLSSMGILPFTPYRS